MIALILAAFGLISFWMAHVISKSNARTADEAAPKAALIGIVLLIAAAVVAFVF